jgi:hypothetical protein
MSTAMFKMVNGVSVELSDQEVADRLAEELEWENGRDARAASGVRYDRDNRLKSHVDPIVSNPLRWASMSSEKQGEWMTYRQALLDVPQQAGFPHNVVWPIKPE